MHNIFLWLNEGMKIPAPMANDILNNALFHSIPRINQSLHSRPAILYSGLVAELCPRFVVNWIDVRVVRWRQIWKFTGAYPEI